MSRSLNVPVAPSSINFPPVVVNPFSFSSSSSSSSSSNPVPLALRRPFKFVIPEGTDTELYDCPICFNVHHDPVQHGFCGAVACRQCLIDAKWKCPGCNQKIDSSSDLVRINSKITNKLDDFDVQCNECSVTIKYGSLSSHQKDACEVECSYGCGKKMKKRLIQSHQILECPDALVECESVHVMYELGIANKCVCRWTGKRKLEKSHKCAHANVMQFLVPAAEFSKIRRTPILYKGMKVDCKLNLDPWQTGEVLRIDRDGLRIQTHTGIICFNITPLGTHTNRDSSSSSSSVRNARRIERLIDIDEESADPIGLEDDLIEEIDPFSSSDEEEEEEKDDGMSNVERLTLYHQNGNDSDDEPAPAPVVLPAGRRDTFLYRREGSQFLVRTNPSQPMKPATLISRHSGTDAVLICMAPYSICSWISRSDPMIEIQRVPSNRRFHLVKFAVGGIVGVRNTSTGRIENKTITNCGENTITLGDTLRIAKSDPTLRVTQRSGIKVYKGSLVKLSDHGSIISKAIVLEINWATERITTHRFDAAMYMTGPPVENDLSDFDQLVRV